MDALVANQFKASLLHDPRWARRELMAEPGRWIPLVVEAAVHAAPADAARIGKVLCQTLQAEESQRVAEAIVELVPHGVAALASAVIQALTVLLAGRRPASAVALRRWADLSARLSKWHAQSGNLPEAARWSRRCLRANAALARHDASCGVRVVASTLYLAQCLAALGRHRDAIQMAEHALESSRTCQPAHLAAACRLSALETLAEALLGFGDSRGALPVAQRLQAGIPKAGLGERDQQELHAQSSLLLAKIHLHLGDPRRAHGPAMVAWKTYQSLAHEEPQRFESRYLLANQLASAVTHALGMQSPAGPQRGESLAAAESVRIPGSAAGEHRRMIYLAHQASELLEMDRPDEALSAAEQAASVARRLRSRFGKVYASDEGNVFMVLGLLRHRRGEHPAARLAVGRALRLFASVADGSSATKARLRKAQDLAASLGMLIQK